MNYTYQKKIIYSKWCVKELETDFFVIIKDINVQLSAFNFLENRKQNPEESKKALSRIKKWLKDNHPEDFM